MFFIPEKKIVTVYLERDSISKFCLIIENKSKLNIKVRSVLSNGKDNNKEVFFMKPFQFQR